MQEMQETGSVPGSGISPGEGNGNPLQYFCLENPMDGEAWRATVYGIAKSQTRLKQLSRHALTHEPEAVLWIQSPPEGQSGIWAMLTLAKYQTKTQARGLQLQSYICLCLHFQTSKLQECLTIFFFSLRYSTRSNCVVKCVPSESPGNITGTALIHRASYYPSLTAITIFSAPTNKTQFWNTLHP